MNRIIVPLFLFCATCLVAVRRASAITIDTVPVGDLGDGNDPLTGGLYGSVNYAYSIGTYDVSVGQYTAFLNAVAATDTYALYDTSMATYLNTAGISRSSLPGNYSYNVIGSINQPVTFVSWGDAARFANWLSNGQPTGAEGNGTTETGSYTLNGAVTAAALAAITRNANATWVIPTENEWYKAAYYDPVAEHYWRYATGSNTTPTSAPPGSTPNTANYYDSTTGYAVTGSSYSISQNYLTDVGAYSASASPYGTFDQSGDVFQWNETSIYDAYRGFRGGSWDNNSNYLPATYRPYGYPNYGSYGIGFRVATVPEPSTAILAALGLLGLIGMRRRHS